MKVRIFEIKDRLIEKAQRKSKEMGRLNRSITKGDGNIAGFIGEEIARYVYNGKLYNTYDYDLILPDGRKADVKTKRTTVEKILPHYECSIYEEGKFQKCDLYIFCRVNMNTKIAFLIGSLPKDKYFEKAKFMRKGQYDPDNGFYVKHNCYNVSVNELDCPPKKEDT